MKQLFNKQHKYSIRKFSIGVCSAVIGLSFLNAGTAYADGPDSASTADRVVSADNGEPPLATGSEPVVNSAAEGAEAPAAASPVGAEDESPLPASGPEAPALASGAEAATWSVDASHIPTPRKVVTQEVATIASIAVSSTNTSWGASNNPEHVKTEDYNNYWASAWKETPVADEFLELTLSAEAEVSAIKYRSQYHGNGKIKKGYIQYQEEGSDQWQNATINNITGADGVSIDEGYIFNVPDSVNHSSLMTINLNPIMARKLRLKGIETYRSNTLDNKMLSAATFVPVAPKVVRLENVLEDTDPVAEELPRTESVPRSSTEAVAAVSIEASEHTVKLGDLNNALDTDPATTWVGVGTTGRPTLTVKLADVARVDRLLYQPLTNGKTSLGSTNYHHEAGVAHKGYIEYSLTGAENDWHRVLFTGIEVTERQDLNFLENNNTTFSRRGSIHPTTFVFNPVEARYLRMTATTTFVGNDNVPVDERNKLLSASTFLPGAKKLLIEETKTENLTTTQIHYLYDSTRYVDEEKKLQDAVPGRRVTVTTFNTENGVKTTQVGAPVVTVTNPQKAVYIRGTKLRPVISATFVQGEAGVEVTLPIQARAEDTVVLLGVDGASAQIERPGAGILTLPVTAETSLSEEMTVVVRKDGVDSEPVRLTRVAANTKYEPRLADGVVTFEVNTAVTPEEAQAIETAIKAKVSPESITNGTVSLPETFRAADLVASEGQQQIRVTVTYLDGTTDTKDVPVTVTAPVVVPVATIDGYPDAAVGIKTITASSGANVENLLDKRDTTIWSSAPESAEGDQYIQVELEEEALVRSITYVPAKAMVNNLHPTYLTRAKLAYSLDGRDWIPLRPKGTTLDSKGYAYDITDNGIALGANTTTKNIHFTPVRAKFIRLIGTESWVAPARGGQEGISGKTFSASEISVDAIKTVVVSEADLVTRDNSLTQASSEGIDGVLRSKEYATDGVVVGNNNYWTSVATTVSFKEEANASLRPHFTVGLTEDAYVNHLVYTPRLAVGHATGNLRRGYIEYRRSDEPETTWHRVTDDEGQVKFFDVPATTDTHILQFKPVIGQHFRIVAVETYNYFRSDANNNKSFAATEISVMGRKIDKETEVVTKPEATREPSADYYFGVVVPDASRAGEDGSRYTGRVFLTENGTPVSEPLTDVSVPTSQIAPATAPVLFEGTFRPTITPISIKRGAVLEEEMVRAALTSADLLPETSIVSVGDRAVTAEAGPKVVPVTVSHRGHQATLEVPVTVVALATDTHHATAEALTVRRGTLISREQVEGQVQIPAGSNGRITHVGDIPTADEVGPKTPVAVTVTYDDDSTDTVSVAVTVTALATDTYHATAEALTVRRGTVISREQVEGQVQIPVGSNGRITHVGDIPTTDEAGPKTPVAVTVTYDDDSTDTVSVAVTVTALATDTYHATAEALVVPHGTVISREQVEGQVRIPVGSNGRITHVGDIPTADVAGPKTPVDVTVAYEDDSTDTVSVAVTVEEPLAPPVAVARYTQLRDGVERVVLKRASDLNSPDNKDKVLANLSFTGGKVGQVSQLSPASITNQLGDGLVEATVAFEREMIPATVSAVSTNRHWGTEANVLNESSDQFWGSDWSFTRNTAEAREYLTLTFDEESEVSHIRYQPRHGAGYIGAIKKGYIEYKPENGQWTRLNLDSILEPSPITIDAEKNFIAQNVRTDADLRKVITFRVETPVLAKQIRLVAEETHGDNDQQANHMVAVATFYAQGTHRDRIEVPVTVVALDTDTHHATAEALTVRRGTVISREQIEGQVQIPVGSNGRITHVGDIPTTDEAGPKTPVAVTVTYDDDSTDTVSVAVTVTALATDTHHATAEALTVRRGTVISREQIEGQVQIPAGSNGRITHVGDIPTADEAGPKTPVSVTVTYDDDSTDTVSVAVTVTALATDTHHATAEALTVRRGTVISREQIEGQVQIPAGSNGRITHVGDIPTTDEVGPKTPVAVTVTYDDDSTDTVSVVVTVTALATDTHHATAEALTVRRGTVISREQIEGQVQIPAGSNGRITHVGDIPTTDEVGPKTPVTVTVTYDDDSTDTVSVAVTVTALATDTHHATAEALTVRRGTVISREQVEGQVQIPAGSNGRITHVGDIPTADEVGPKTPVAVTVTYDDDSTDTVSVAVTVTALATDTYHATAEALTVRRGTVISREQVEGQVQIPVGSNGRITHVGDIPTTDEAGPKTPVAVTVTYDDDSTDTVSVAVTVIANASDTYIASATSLVKDLDDALTPEEIKAAVIVPDEAGEVTKQIEGPLPSTSEVGDHSVPVKVIYNDTSFDMVEVTVRVTDETNRQALLDLIRRQEAELARIRLEKEQADVAKAQALADKQAADEAKAQALADKQAADEAKAQALADKQAADEAKAQAITDKQASDEAKAQALADKQAADEAKAQALADKQAADEAKAQALADKQAADEAKAQALADKQAADEAKAQALADKQAADEAKAQALADKQAADEAKAQALADKQAADEAKAQAITDKQASDEAKAQALADKQAADEAKAQALADKQAADEAKAQALADKQAADEAKAQAITDKQASDEAKAQALADKQAADEAKAQALADKQAADEAKAQALTDKQASDEAKAQALADKQAADEAKAQALADKQAADEAKAQALADKQAADEAKAQALADKQAADEAKAQALTDKQASDEAKAQALADKQAADEAKAQALADKQAADEAKAQALADKQAADEAKAQALADKAAAVAQAVEQVNEAQRQTEAARQAAAEAEATKAQALEQLDAARTRETEAIAKVAAAETAKTSALDELARAKAAEAQAARDLAQAQAAKATAEANLAQANRDNQSELTAAERAKTEALESAEAARRALAEVTAAKQEADRLAVEATRAKDAAQTDLNRVLAEKVAAETRATEADQAKARAEASLEEAETARARAEEQLTQAVVAQATAEREKAEALAAAEREKADAIAAANRDKVAAEAAKAQAQAAVAEQERATALAELAQAQAAKATAEANLAAAEAAKLEAEREKAEALAIASNDKAAAEAAKLIAEARAADAQRDLHAAQAQLTQAQEAITLAQAKVAAAEAAKAAAEREKVEALAAAEQEQAELERQKAELEAALALAERTKLEEVAVANHEKEVALAAKLLAEQELEAALRAKEALLSELASSNTDLATAQEALSEKDLALAVAQRQLAEAEQALEEAEAKLAQLTAEPTTPVTPEEPSEPTTPVTPEEPSEPTTPVTPEEPSEPTTPVTPEEPSEPTTPVTPEEPSEPTTPVTPEEPSEPTTPVTPEEPSEPTTPVTPEEPSEPTTPVSPEEVSDPTSPVIPEEVSDPTTPVSPEDVSDPTSPVSPEDVSDPTSPVSPEEVSDPTSPVSPEDVSDPTSPVSPEDVSDPTSPVSPEAVSDPTSPVSPEEVSDPTSPVTPEEPSEPTTPVIPEEPSEPTTPVTPEEPSEPMTPVTPEEPSEPTTPVTPEEPSEPTTPVTPEEPSESTTPVTPEEPSEPTTPVTPAPARVFADPATGVTVALAAGEESAIVALRIVHKETSDVATPVVLAGKDYDLFDIELVDKAGQVIKTRYAAEVILPVDAGKEVVEVIYLPTADRSTALPFRTATLADGQNVVVFTAPHFSEYGIVYRMVTPAPKPVETSSPVVTEEFVDPAVTPVVVARLTPKASATSVPAAPAAQAPAASAPAQASLPETGDEDSMAFSLGMAGLMSALGLMGVKSRKED